MEVKPVDQDRKRQKSIAYFTLSFGVALGLTFLVKEPSFSDSEVYVLFFAIGFWLTEAVPPFAVSLFIIAYLVLAMGNSHINSSPENIEKYQHPGNDCLIVNHFLTRIQRCIHLCIPLGMAILVGFKSEVALIIALSASTAMFLPVSTPPNAIAFSTGLLEQKDFRIGGILIGLLGPVLAIIWVLFVS